MSHITGAKCDYCGASGGYNEHSAEDWWVNHALNNPSHANWIDFTYTKDLGDYMFIIIPLAFIAVLVAGAIVWYCMKPEPNAAAATSASRPMTVIGSDGTVTQVAEELPHLTVKNLAGMDIEVYLDSQSFILKTDAEYTVDLAKGHHNIKVAAGDYSITTGFTLKNDDVISVKNVYGQLRFA